MTKKKQSDEQPDPVKQRLVRLMAYLRSQVGGRSVGAFANHLNRNLPERQHLSLETIRRWEKGTQAPSADKVELLARALGIEFVELNEYLLGENSWENLLIKIQPVENPIDEALVVGEIIRLIRKLSPTLLIEVMGRAWEILQEKLQDVTLAPKSNTKTIAKLVQSEKAECIEMFEGIIDQEEARVNAIASGSRPTDEELELISSVVGVSLEQLKIMRKEEFGNGANGTTHQGCVSNR